MASVQRIPLPDWLTLDEAAVRLGITRQAVGQAALRGGWGRGRIGKMLLLSRSDVERYRRTRQLSGPRRKRPAPAAT